MYFQIPDFGTKSVKIFDWSKLFMMLKKLLHVWHYLTVTRMDNTLDVKRSAASFTLKFLPQSCCFYCSLGGCKSYFYFIKIFTLSFTYNTEKIILIH